MDEFSEMSFLGKQTDIKYREIINNFADDSLKTMIDLFTVRETYHFLEDIEKTYECNRLIRVVVKEDNKLEGYLDTFEKIAKDRISPIIKMILEEEDFNDW
jgi:hypothetical protein